MSRNKTKITSEKSFQQIKQILNYLKRNKEITLTQAAKLVNKTEEYMREVLKEYVKMGLLEKKIRKNGHKRIIYVIKQNYKHQLKMKQIISTTRTQNKIKYIMILLNQIYC